MSAFNEFVGDLDDRPLRPATRGELAFWAASNSATYVKGVTVVKAKQNHVKYRLRTDAEKQEITGVGTDTVDGTLDPYDNEEVDWAQVRPFNLRKTSDTGPLIAEWFNLKGNDRTDNTAALNTAMVTARDESRTLNFSHQWGQIYRTGPIAPLPNDTDGKILAVIGQSTRGTIFRASGAGADEWIVQGDATEPDTGGLRNWGSAHFANFAVATSDRMLGAIVERHQYPQTHIDDVHFEGFVQGTGPSGGPASTINPDSDRKVIRRCSFHDNDTAITLRGIGDTVEGCRFSLGEIGVLVSGAHSPVITASLFAQMGLAAVKVAGNGPGSWVSGMVWMGGRVDNGYGNPDGVTAALQGGTSRSIDTGRTRSMVAAGALWVDNVIVTGLIMNGVTCSLRDSLWAIKLDLAGHAVQDFEVSHSSPDRHSTGAGTVVLFSGDVSGVENMVYHRSYTSAGNWAQFTNDESRFLKFPYTLGFGADRPPLDTIPEAIPSEFNAVGSDINQSVHQPKYRKMLAFATTTKRFVHAAGPNPSDPWLNVNSGSIVYSPG